MAQNFIECDREQLLLMATERVAEVLSERYIVVPPNDVLANTTAYENTTANRASDTFRDMILGPNCGSQPVSGV